MTETRRILMTLSDDELLIYAAGAAAGSVPLPPLLRQRLRQLIDEIRSKRPYRIHNHPSTPHPWRRTA